MKNIKLLLLMSFVFLAEIGLAQNYVTYSSLSKTIDLNSGVEGTVDVLVNCYGSSSTPVFLNAIQSCGSNDGILSTNYTDGSILTPGQNTTIRYKFKKTVTTNTQVVYKFSTNGSCFQDESKMIKITVNYKAQITNPTNPQFVNQITIYSNYNGTIISNLSIYEGSVASEIIGIENQPPGYELQWEKKNGNGAWMPVFGEVHRSYSPGVLLETTMYRRTAKKTGSLNISISNEVTYTVNPAPLLQNNTITLNGEIVEGSMPTGGLGGYTYLFSWYVTDEDGDSSDLHNGSYYQDLSSPEFDRYFNSPHNFTITRGVVSGLQRLGSNRVILPHNTPLQNNIITLSGSIVEGSLPTGGINFYKYSWYILDDGERTDLDETSPNYILFTPEFNKYFDSSHNLTITRLVTSRNQIIASNRIEIPNLNNIENNIISSTAYPNPTSGSINFITGFSSNKEIEISVYSEELGRTQSIFKGTATPNQIVQCNIPSNYPKGIYYYKIVSEKKEVKTGKIIFK